MSVFLINNNLYEILLSGDRILLERELKSRKQNLTKNEIEILNSLYKKIQLQDKNSLLILYGSRARGDSKPGSDFDICILLEINNELTQKNISEIIWESGFENELIFQTVYFTFDEIFLEKNYKSRFIQNILSEGIVLSGN